VVYYIPDLDGNIEAWINSSTDGTPLACLETEVSNGASVMQTSVAFILFFLVLLFFISAISLWIKGFHVSATYLYTKAFGLMTYYQSIALFGELSQK
jgi:hypothetical protein